MTTLTEAARAALEALDDARHHMSAMGAFTEVQIAAQDTLRAALAASEVQAEPGAVATVTECEACFTPDVCRLRGTCDHYAAERLRIAAHPPATEQPAPALASAPRVPQDLQDALAAERERLCTAIKAADDKASEGDYMLDSDDCISVIRGTWRPDEAAPQPEGDTP
jgi:hypothetical protein